MKRTEITAPRHASAPKRTAIARFRSLVVVTVLAMVAALLPLGLLSPAQGATLGQGFTVTPADLAFILKQIKIAEAHVAAGPGPEATDPVNCQAMIGTGPNQIESPLLTLGLRTVDGTCNNLQPGQEKYGAADMTFPRLTTPEFNVAEASTSYAQTSGAVTDSEPRTVSNLIVDQTVTNPSAVSAATTPVRSQSGALVLCTGGPSDPADCLPATGSLDIPNVTTDVGLSPPFNSLFTIFGQFFDHGLDKITNGGNGTVFVPLKADDPLRTVGPDGDPSTNDAVPASQAFMVVTRGSIVEGADGLRNAPNTDTPFVDQSQTYTSHASHQVFLRQYEVPVGGGQPQSTGKFLSTPDGEGLATWAMIKAQAANLLGLQLSDSDVGDIPMIAADAYGRFIPGPARRLPQYVTASGLVEGNTANGGLPVPNDVVRIGTAFLNDIAHSAAPTPGGPDADSTAGGSLDTAVPAGSYDDELLDLHAICGDGRCNENIALQAVHQIFHNEHDRLIDDIKATLGATPNGDWTRQAREPGSAGPVAGVPDSGWGYGERLFQAARFVTEMEYQHLVFEEFARKVQPGINPFEPFAFGQTDINPAITAEFAHAVYRFGHSMLTDTIPRINPTTGASFPIDLLDGFLNPAAYTQATTDGPTGALTPKEAAGAIIMGLSDQVGQEIDEFVVDTLRNNLLGLPLDLPAINMARARSEGVPPLNEVRRQINAATNDGAMKPYTDWVDFGQQLKHPESLVNFVAAYGTHPTITSATTLAGRRAAAKLIVNPGIGEVQPADSGDFMFGTNYDETADNTPAVPAVDAGAGPDGVLGDVDPTTDPTTQCTAANDPIGCNESLDDTPAVPAVSEGPGPDGILNAVNDPATNWANRGGETVTGVDDIDLWMGGLAERTNLFGGLLGSTFNYVFEKQLTDLQNGDRFYYLARTPGMNLRAQLEGNSFSELVMRNTDARNLKADPFATADCKFDLENITWPATSMGSSGILITGPGSVQDDPASECDENEHLLRMADGTIRYRMTNTAMPSGINAQAVYDGKRGAVVDRIWGGADNDTFWGREANDIIEGGDGADVALGGEGNDIITDLAGDDVPKGGPGNDAIDGGPGLDILMGGDGKDFMNGGANTNETFGGEGDDFVIAGEGMDAVFGDSGDDWVEGGDQPDLLIGDSSSFFFDDHNLPGHDILIGQGGDDDYDHEGGDDIGVAGPGVEKTAGAAGFDWQIGVGDPQAQDMDLAQVFVAGGVIAPGVRDKFNEVEALSGGNLNDTLRGDDVVPTAVGGGGFVGCDALDAAGVARISGLNALVPAALLTVPAADLEAASATHNCLLTGNVWGAGNILLGGSGNDLLEGRGADDILDGDRYVNVRLSVRNPASPGTEMGTTDRMTGTPKSGNFGAGTAGMTLQQAVFAGLVNPGNIVAVREILTSTTANTDVALFSGPRTDYEITLGTAGGEPFVTVNHTGGTAADGIDTLRNVETLRFTTGDVPVDSITAPVPVAEIAPAATLAFGLRDTGSTTPLPVVVTNTGLAPLTVSSAVVSPAGAFTVAGNNCTTVAPAGTCTISVAFAPTTTVAQTAQLAIVHNAAGSPRTITLTGQGQAPVIRPVMTLPATTAFGRRVVGTNRTQNVRVANQGPGVLRITSVSATGQFTAALGTCTAPVAVGRTCNLAVTFRPTSVGPATGTLSVVSNAVGSPRTAALTGTGRG